jgi:hypothetical protein
MSASSSTASLSSLAMSGGGCGGGGLASAPAPFSPIRPGDGAVGEQRRQSQARRLGVAAVPPTPCWTRRADDVARPHPPHQPHPARPARALHARAASADSAALAALLAAACGLGAGGDGLRHC